MIAKRATLRKTITAWTDDPDNILLRHSNDSKATYQSSQPHALPSHCEGTSPGCRLSCSRRKQSGYSPPSEKP